MSAYRELWPDADDVLGLNIGGDEFPRISSIPKPTPPEQRVRLDKMEADYIANAGWDKTRNRK